MATTPRIIFGTGASSIKTENGLKDLLTVALQNGIFAFDTAPSYKTEAMLGRSLDALMREKRIPREQLHIQTKIDPIQMYEGKVENHVESVLHEMKLDYFDCLLVHWPVHKYFMDTWDALKRLKASGIVKSIGICNLRVLHLRELKTLDIIPDVLQIERHPLNTFEGERQFSKDNNILLQDYSPLCKMNPLLRESTVLKEMASRYNVNIGQLILRWHIDTGATPIFTSQKPSRIMEYSRLESFSLQDGDITAIGEMNINHKMYLESLICPGF